MKLILGLVGLFLTKIVLAAGDGHGGGHATDLIAPAVNVAILVGFLVWKLKSPLKNHFTEKAESVANQMNSAEIKAREAEEMIKRAESKMSNLDQEIASVKKQTEEEIKEFEKTYQSETEAKIAKLSVDAEARVEAEKNAKLNSLNEELIDKIIEDAKAMVKGDPSKSQKITEKLLQSLGK